jgi:hypothetical protein
MHQKLQLPRTRSVQQCMARVQHAKMQGSEEMAKQGRTTELIGIAGQSLTIAELQLLAILFG